MDPETNELRAEIAQTRAQLGESVGDLSARLSPRDQAQQVLLQQRDAALARLRTLSAADASAAAARARAAVQGHPRAAAALGAVAVLLVRRRRRG